MINRIIKSSLFYFLPLIPAVSLYAQEKISIQIIGQPGISMGGEYDVRHQSALTSFTLIDARMKKALTYGVEGGVAVSYRFHPYCGIGAGVLYSRQGQKYEDYTWSNASQNYTVTWERRVELNYLKIPVQVEFFFTPENKLSLCVSGGFYLAYLLDFKDEYKHLSSEGTIFTTVGAATKYTVAYVDHSVPIYQSTTPFETNPYDVLDFGGIIGFGLQFQLSELISIPFMLNYQYGFSNAKNETSRYESVNTSELFWSEPNSAIPYRNSFLGLKTGIQFTLP